MNENKWLIIEEKEREHINEAIETCYGKKQILDLNERKKIHMVKHYLKTNKMHSWKQQIRML